MATQRSDKTISQFDTVELLGSDILLVSRDGLYYQASIQDILFSGQIDGLTGIFQNFRSGQYEFLNVTQRFRARDIIGGANNNNLSTGMGSAILAGDSHDVTGTSSIVGGGTNNDNYGVGSAILGGATNEISAGSLYCLVGAGQANEIKNAVSWGTIVGGRGNIIQNDSSYSHIGGGQNHLINGSRHSVIQGGFDNLVNLTSYSFVGGGQSNEVSGDFSSIVGGRANAIDNDGDYNFIGGGRSNVIYGPDITPNYCFIGGGWNNQNRSGPSNAILGGQDGVNSGEYSVLLGGQGNHNLSRYSTHLGGQMSTIRSGADWSVGFGRNYQIKEGESGAAVLCGTNGGTSSGINTMVLDYPNGTYIPHSLHVQGVEVQGNQLNQLTTIQGITGNAIYETNPYAVSDISAGTYTVDFDGPAMNYISGLATNLTFNTTNRPTFGLTKSVSLIIQNDSFIRTFTLSEANVRHMGPAITGMSPNSYGVLNFTAIGPGTEHVIASFAEEV